MEVNLKKGRTGNTKNNFQKEIIDGGKIVEKSKNRKKELI